MLVTSNIVLGNRADNTYLGKSLVNHEISDRSGQILTSLPGPGGPLGGRPKLPPPARLG